MFPIINIPPDALHQEVTPQVKKAAFETAGLKVTVVIDGLLKMDSEYLSDYRDIETNRPVYKPKRSDYTAEELLNKSEKNSLGGYVGDFLVHGIQGYKKLVEDPGYINALECFFDYLEVVRNVGLQHEWDNPNLLNEYIKQNSLADWFPDYGRISRDPKRKGPAQLLRLIMECHAHYLLAQETSSNMEKHIEQ